MNIRDILLIIIIIYLIFLNYKKKNIEKFAEIDDITAAVKEIYNIDMNNIRTLSKISEQIYNNNTLNINGDLIVDGDINCNDITFVDTNNFEKSLLYVNDIANRLGINITEIDNKYNEFKNVISGYKKKLNTKINFNSPVQFIYSDDYKLTTDSSNIKILGVTTENNDNTKWKINNSYKG